MTLFFLYHTIRMPIQLPAHVAAFHKIGKETYCSWTHSTGLCFLFFLGSRGQPLVKWALSWTLHWIGWCLQPSYGLKYHYLDLCTTNGSFLWKVRTESNIIRTKLIYFPGFCVTLCLSINMESWKWYFKSLPSISIPCESVALACRTARSKTGF